MDASKKFGCNYLCVREDRVLIPRTDFGAEFRVKYDINANFQSRICPLSTLGLGHAGAVSKLLNCAGLYLMESESNKQFHSIRNEVRGYTSDQGVEKDCGEGTVKVIPMFHDFESNSRQSFMFPQCLVVPGHLHILYNALREAIEKLPIAKEFLANLAVVQDFLSDKELRLKFVAECLRESSDAALFKHYHVVHIDWRWEFLSKALDKLVPLFIPLRDRFDLARVSSGDAGPVRLGLLRQVDVVLRKKFFVEFCEMIRISGKAVETTAHKLEGCHCHASVWTSKKGTKRKLERQLAWLWQSNC